ncbi:hypothetical protein ACWZHB_01255 [Nocardia sp. FBN12]|uniref:hypothetical protein n=1 Tax=Nocardia sp. FBN12 TaxID=3419766 RepID=UPI003CFDAD39
MGEEFTPRGWWKISRPCYDKSWRCPGWNGGGMRYAKVAYCPSGYITWGMSRAALEHLPSAEVSRYPAWNALGQCSKCDVRVLPAWVRQLDPTYWLGEIQRVPIRARRRARWWLRDLDDWIENWWADR